MQATVSVEHLLISSLFPRADARTDPPILIVYPTSWH